MKRTLIALLAVLASSAAHAEVYADLGTGVSAPGNKQFGLPFRIGVGVAPDPVPLELEADYLLSGQMRNHTGGPQSAFEGGLFMLGYREAFGSQASSFSLRGGWYEGRSSVSKRDFAPDQDDGARGVATELGWEYRFLPWLGLQVTLDALFRMPDFSSNTDPNAELKGNGHTTLMVLGVGAVFGTGSAASQDQYRASREAKVRRRDEQREERRAQARRALEVSDQREIAAAKERELAAAKQLEEIQARQQAAGATVPAQPPAPNSNAAPAPVLTAGGKAHLRTGAIVRTRARPDGDPVGGFPAGDDVIVKAAVRNETGKWWYVQAATKAGWILEEDLEARP